jgi:L-cysteine/cystine lyase
MTEARFAQREQAPEQIRRELASLCAVDPARLALSRSTSASIETVIRGFPWVSGDEVICTQLEHQAITAPLAEQSRRHQFNVRIAQVPEQAADDLQGLAKCVTARTRLIAFSGVAYTTGQQLPIQAIGAFARERGIGTLLDAAQCVGAMPLNLAQSGIDFCAFPLQKWLLGPEGIGALYVREGMPDDLLRDRMTQSRGVLEATTVHLDWLREQIGWPWIFERTQKLAALAREVLAGVPELTVITPAAHAGLVTVETDPVRNAEIAIRLKRRRIALRTWPELGRYRLSTAFFNTDKEINAVARALQPR